MFVNFPCVLCIFLSQLIVYTDKLPACLAVGVFFVVFVPFVFFEKGNNHLPAV